MYVKMHVCASNLYVHMTHEQDDVYTRGKLHACTIYIHMGM